MLVHSSGANLPVRTMSLLLRTWLEPLSGRMFYARPGSALELTSALDRRKSPAV